MRKPEASGFQAVKNQPQQDTQKEKCLGTGLQMLRPWRAMLVAEKAGEQAGRIPQEFSSETELSLSCYYFDSSEFA